jgi:hypothetical protein
MSRFLGHGVSMAFRVEKEGVCGHVLIRWGGSPGSKMQPLTFSNAQIMQVHFHLLPTVISGPFRPPLFHLPARFLNQSDLPLLPPQLPSYSAEFVPGCAGLLHTLTPHCFFSSLLLLFLSPSFRKEVEVAVERTPSLPHLLLYHFEQFHCSYTPLINGPPFFTIHFDRLD